MLKVIRAKILNPQSDYSVEVLLNGGIAFDLKGKIVFCGDFDEFKNIYSDYELIDYSEKILLPGLIDLHTHLPQLGCAGVGQGQLLNWLNDYIFPLEEKFSDLNYALHSANNFFEELIRKGTTTAVIYAPAQYNACDIAFEAAHSFNFRAFMGNTMMDKNVLPSLQSTASEIIQQTMQLARKWHKNGKIQYVLTPRFAIACSIQLLETVGKFAKDNDFFIQTHLAENNEECKLSCEMFGVESYAEIYEKYGLFTSKSIFAHSIYLSDKDMEIFKNNDSIIAHCPNSNRFLSSGIMPLSKYLANSMKVGLGTDVAAGFSLSMLNEAREAVESSKMLDVFGRDTVSFPPQNPATALALATIKPAEYLGISDEVGNFVVGKQADFAIFDLPKYIDYSILRPQDYISLALYNIDNYNADAVFIDGKQINI